MQVGAMQWAGPAAPDHDDHHMQCCCHTQRQAGKRCAAALSPSSTRGACWALCRPASIAREREGEVGSQLCRLSFSLLWLGSMETYVSISRVMMAKAICMTGRVGLGPVGRRPPQPASADLGHSASCWFVAQAYAWRASCVPPVVSGWTAAGAASGHHHGRRLEAWEKCITKNRRSSLQKQVDGRTVQRKGRIIKSFNRWQAGDRTHGALVGLAGPRGEKGSVCVWGGGGCPHEAAAAIVETWSKG